MSDDIIPTARADVGPVAATVDELLAGATSREAIVAADGKSGNALERVAFGGESLVVKYVTLEGDWIMRVAGDRVFWPFVVWRSGLLDRLPGSIDHAMVAMALDDTRPVRTLAVLMRDVGAHLVPEGDDVVPLATHAGLLDDMAAMHAAYWGWADDLGLQTMRQRVLMFAPTVIAPERTRDPDNAVVRTASEGWDLLPRVAPALAERVLPLHAEPGPLLAALATTPSTFVHGDWKMGNLGRRPDGRTVLLDWAYLGAAPPTWDLAWYLALNRARLPESKEAAVERYRSSLERAGVDTGEWFERQWDLVTVAIMVTFGWEKAVGDREELAWWDEQVARGAKRLP